MNTIDKLFSQESGFAAIVKGSEDIAAFDPCDELWVRTTATKNAGGRKVRLLRVSHAVTSAWVGGDWSRPVQVDHGLGEIYFAGQGVLAAVLAGRRDALESALKSAVTPGRHQ